jgi:hypothetical protein
MPEYTFQGTFIRVYPELRTSVGGVLIAAPGDEPVELEHNPGDGFWVPEDTSELTYAALGAALTGGLGKEQQDGQDGPSEPEQEA